MIKIKKVNTILELKTKLFQELNNKNFKNLITLTYSADCYPKDEYTVKDQLASFNHRLKKLDPTSYYFYVYDIQPQSNQLYVYLLSTIAKLDNLNKLKTCWFNIIKTEQITNFNFEEVTFNNLEKVFFSVLKTFETGVEKNLQSRLNTKKIIGGSTDCRSLLKEIHCKIVLPDNFYELDPESKLETITEKIYDSYKDKNIDIELVKSQLILELNSYTDVLDLLYYQNLENFLLKGKSKVSKGYLKFYNFIKEICAKEIYVAETLLKSWYSKKERRTPLVEKVALILKLNEGESFLSNEVLFRVCLDYLIKACLRNVSMSTITYSLGKLILKKEDFESEIQEEDYRKIGAAMYLIIKNTFKDKLNFNVVETQQIEKETLSTELTAILDNFESIISISQRIEFSFNEKWLQQIKEDKRITKTEISRLVQFHSPMLVEPRDWEIPQDLSKEYGSTEDMYNAGCIINGGILLNGYYFKKPLQKNKHNGNEHQLAVSKQCIDTINKLQKIPFIVNKNQLNILKKYKKYIPDNLTTLKKTDLLLLRKEKRRIKKELYQKVEQDKKENKTNANDRALINELRNEIEECASKLSKHELFNRVLSGFTDLSEYKEHYYSYDLDFRMRLYPQQNELSPQGSKLSRSLICFKEKTEFNYHEFKLYSARLHAKTYVFKEDDLLFHYNNYVYPLFEQFIINADACVHTIFTEEIAEPYLFLAACLEYKEYKEAEFKNEKYSTGFPLILDCSGSGPQIMSLLFLLETFSNFLNLNTNKDGLRQDYYVSIINQFLYEYIPVNRKTKKGDEVIEVIAVNVKLTYLKADISDTEKSNLLILLRSICKNSIMTQLYGITYITFRRKLESGFLDKANKNKIQKYLKADISSYDTFMNDFINEFWYFQQRLDLYILREFFQTLVGLLKDSKDASLNWSTLDVSKISVKYTKYKKKKIDFKDKLLGRLQMDYRESTPEPDYNKIRSSAQANFIHSLDAAVNMHVLTKFNDSIFPIHDAWGVPSGKSVELRNLVSEIYLKIAKDNIVLQKCIEEFVQRLTESVSKTAGESFKTYCKKNILIGKYDPSVLPNCKFMVYY